MAPARKRINSSTSNKPTSGEQGLTGVKRKANWKPGQHKSPEKSQKTTASSPAKRQQSPRSCKKVRNDIREEDEDEGEEDRVSKRRGKDNDSDYDNNDDEAGEEQEEEHEELMIEGDTEARKELEEKQRLLEKHKSTAEEIELTRLEEGHLGTTYCERVFHEYKFISNDMLVEEDNEDSIMRGAYELLGFTTKSRINKKRTAVKNYIKYQTGRFREYFVSSVKKGVIQGSRLGKRKKDQKRKNTNDTNISITATLYRIDNRFQDRHQKTSYETKNCSYKHGG